MSGVLELVELQGKETLTAERSLTAMLDFEGARLELIVTSYARNGEPWTPPRLWLPSGPGLTHEQWLRLHKAATGLFVEFARRWPIDAKRPYTAPVLRELPADDPRVREALDDLEGRKKP